MLIKKCFYEEGRDLIITHFYWDFNFELALVTEGASCTNGVVGYQEPADPNTAVRDYYLKFLVFLLSNFRQNRVSIFKIKFFRNWG